jgi:hypothetical protein
VDNWRVPKAEAVVAVVATEVVTAATAAEIAAVVMAAALAAARAETVAAPAVVAGAPATAVVVPELRATLPAHRVAGVVQRPEQQAAHRRVRGVEAPPLVLAVAAVMVLTAAALSVEEHRHR